MVTQEGHEGVGININDIDETESEYDGSEDLHSCSGTDEEGIGPSKPRYAKFHEEFDMKDPQFQIGMMFSSFNQFKEVVRNYGVKNRFVMNF